MAIDYTTARISDLSPGEVAAELRIDCVTPVEMQRKMDIVKGYISRYTGLPVASDDPNEETIDTYPELVHAFLVLCQDCYDNRSYIQEGTQGVNKVVDSILGMHRRNLVC